MRLLVEVGDLGEVLLTARALWRSPRKALLWGSLLQSCLALFLLYGSFGLYPEVLQPPLLSFMDSCYLPVASPWIKWILILKHYKFPEPCKSWIP